MWSGVITNAGQSLLSVYAQGGHTLHLDGAKVGSGTTAAANMRAATDLNTVKDTAQIMGAGESGGGTKIRVQVGPHATAGYTAKDVGIWAHVDDGESVMLSLNQDDAGGVAIPTRAQNADFVFGLNVIIAVSNTTNLELTVDPNAYVSQSDLEDAIEAASTPATTTTAGHMSAADKAKLDGIAANANKYTHPAYTARTGKPAADASPAFGGTFKVSQITSDAQGHVTGATDRTITIPNAAATTGAAGLMSAADKTKMNNLPAAAATQNAAGWMSAADKTKLDGVAANANNYAHPTLTALTGKPTANAAPGFGETFEVSQVETNSNGHVTALTTRTVKIPDAEATQSAAGLMSAADKAILDDEVLRPKSRPSGVTSLDNYKTAGVYFVSKSNVANGWPDDTGSTPTSTLSMLEVFKFGGNTYGGYVQRLTCNIYSSYPDMYFRSAYNQEAFSEWVKLEIVGNAEPGN